MPYDIQILKRNPNPPTLAQTKTRIAYEASNQEKFFKYSLSAIENLLNQHDPLNILCVVHYYTQMMPIHVRDGPQANPSGLGLEPSHIELLQAMMLRRDRTSETNSLFDKSIVETVSLHLHRITSSRHKINMGHTVGYDNEIDFRISQIQIEIRMYTQVVRNWGHHQQVLRILKDLCTDLDSTIKERKGYSFTNVIMVFEFLLEKLENGMTAKIQNYRTLLPLEEPEEIFGKIAKLGWISEKEIPDILEKVAKHGYNKEQNMVAAMNYMDTTIHDDFSISIEEMTSSGLEISKEDLRSILSDFSIGFGDLAENNIEHVFLENPVWEKPLISLNSGKYCYPLCQSFFAHSLHSLTRICKESKLTTELSNRRAEYLESEIATLLHNKFPDIKIVSNLSWRDKGVEYESDVVAIMDNVILLIEAKSGGITKPALRGAPSRLKERIQGLLVEPNVQSRRLKRKLEHLNNNWDEENQILEQLPIYQNKIKEIVRISVTLEDFGPISTNVESLRDTGWLPEEYEPCATLSLAMFDTVVEYFDSELHFFNYFLQREYIEKNVHYHAIEIDLLSMYRHTWLDRSCFQPDTNHIFRAMSSEVEQYFASLNTSVKLEKPPLNCSEEIALFLETLETNKHEGWIELGLPILSIGPDKHRELIKSLRSYYKKTQKKRNQRKNEPNIFVHKTDSNRVIAVHFTQPNQGATDIDIQTQILKDESISAFLLINATDPDSIWTSTDIRIIERD